MPKKKLDTGTAPGPSSQLPVRVGIVEVGSRAIRLLIADVSVEGVTPIYTSARETHLMRSIQNGASAVVQNLTNIHKIISEFSERAVKLGASPVKIFGTEAIRKLKQLSNDGRFPEPIGIDVLSETEEAVCSLTSAIQSLHGELRPSGSLLVVDQGSGSVELAIGKIGPPIEMLSSRSIPIGDGIAVEKFKSMPPARFQEFVQHFIKGANLPADRVDQVVIQGSAATKLAWLKVRGMRTEYDAKSVHGHLLKASELRQVVSLVSKATPKQRIQLAEIVEPRRSGSAELDRVVAGSVVLLVLLEHFAKDDFLVSSQGTRYGLAWRLAMHTRQN